MALAKENRLTGKKDFERVLKEGVAVKGRSLFIKCRKNSLPASRFGFVISLRVSGSTSARNRIKRVFSETVRQYLRDIPVGLDVVVVVNRKENGDMLTGEFRDLLNRFNQIKI